MSEHLFVSGSEKDIYPKIVTLPELFKTSEIISIQNQSYLQLKQIAFEEMGNPIYPVSSCLFEKINGSLLTLMNIWDAKSRILIASQNISGFKWEKSNFSQDVCLRNPFYHDDSKITLSPKTYNDYYDCNQIGIGITNYLNSPYGGCSVSISLKEAGMGLSVADLSTIKTAPRIKFEFYSSHYDPDKKCQHTIKIGFSKKKVEVMEIEVEGEEKFTYAFEGQTTILPEIISNFQLHGIPESNTPIITK